MLDTPPEFNRFIQNPLAYLAGKNVNIPQGMTDGDQILQHLLLTSQIPQSVYNQAMMKKREMEQSGTLPPPPPGFFR